MKKRQRDRRHLAQEFPFYASDWLVLSARAGMTPEQKAACIDLLCHQWLSDDCTLPADDKQLGVMSGMGDEWNKNGAAVIRQWFPPVPRKPWRIGNERLLERHKLKLVRRKSGSLGGKARQKDNKPAVIEKPPAVIEMPLFVNENPTVVVETPKAEKPKAEVDQTLKALIAGWNKLGKTIVRPGNGVGDNPPPKAVLAAWKRVTRNRELRNAVSDVPALLDAIRKAQFCHCQGWFTLPWIFGKNKNGELNAERLLAGCFTGDSTKTPVPAEEAPKLRYLL